MTSYQNTNIRSIALNDIEKLYQGLVFKIIHCRIRTSRNQHSHVNSCSKTSSTSSSLIITIKWHLTHDLGACKQPFTINSGTLLSHWQLLMRDKTRDRAIASGSYTGRKTLGHQNGHGEDGLLHNHGKHRTLKYLLSGIQKKKKEKEYLWMQSTEIC